MTLPRIQFGRPQQLAALLLLVFSLLGLYRIAHAPLTETDYRYARCGREMWERPSPLLGYFTSCGNMQGDGTFAYRVAGLPLSVQRWAMLGVDHFRKPEDKLYPGDTLNGSTWEARHQLSYVNWLLRLPFLCFGVWLGGALWWVARRLFGNEGGFLALGLYSFCPEVLRISTTPNNEILAAWGIFGLIYTGIGVAHAMQGPRYKWKPRILLLTLALGLTATAHILAAVIGYIVAFVVMLYLAERRRGPVMQAMVLAAVGSMAIVFAFFSFRIGPFSYVFTAGAARFWFSLNGAGLFFANWMENAAIEIALLVSLFLWLTVRRSRYFGNTLPLMVALSLLPLVSTSVRSAPWIWALPFLFAFAGGVFADALETKHRKLFLALSGALLVVQLLVASSWLLVG